MTKCKKCNKWYDKRKWEFEYCYSCAKKQAKLQAISSQFAKRLAHVIMENKKEVK